MAISNAEARTSVERLLAEQFALRRVATLVAKEVALEEFFPVLTREVRMLLDVDAVVVARSGVDGPALVFLDVDESRGWLALFQRSQLQPDRNELRLRDRVEAIGGTFRLDSPSAIGTAIEVRLPLGVGR